MATGYRYVHFEAGPLTRLYLAAEAGPEPQELAFSTIKCTPILASHRNKDKWCTISRSVTRFTIHVL
jgi:hypothetical protein